MKSSEMQKMTKHIFETQTAEGALHWMLRQDMVFRKTTKDPETYATVQGFILSDQLRDLIGSNIVTLLAKANKGGNGRMGNVSIRDAFLTATMAAILEVGHARLSDGEMARCANIIFALLPMDRLEASGLAGRRLRTIARNRSSVEKLQDILGMRAYSTL
jgi:hypothetical protein